MSNDLPLITVEVPGRLRATIRGPRAHPHLALVTPGLIDSDGVLRVRVEGGSPAVVTWSDEHGLARGWSAEAPTGPRLYEDTRYRVTVEDLSASAVPRLHVRDPRVVAEADTHVQHHLLTAVLNFRRQVGSADLRITTPSAAVVVTVEVFPTKLDYESDYQALLHEVSAASRALGLEYLRATYFRGGTDDTDQQTRLEWLVLLRSQVTDLERALRYIAAHPHRALERIEEMRPLERIRRPDPVVRRALARGLGRGEVEDRPGLGPSRPVINSRVSRETLNTPEHRWLRRQLSLVHGQLTLIAGGLKKESDQAALRGRSSVALVAEQGEVTDLARRLRVLLDLPPMAEATGEITTSSPSLTLLNGVGYRDAYRALMILHLGLNVDAGSVELSVSDLHVLYETWCFLRLAQLVSALAGTRTGVASVVETSPSGLRVRLRAGQRSEIHLDAGDRQLVLLYNNSYPGLTGDQRPDIVLEFREDGWPTVIVVFDAKYRLRSDPEYVAAMGVPGPPIDAVNALHRYRDAIVVGAKAGAGRPVVKGVALFPLPNDAVAAFRSGKLYGALDSLGIGALPFTPSSVGLVTEWLASVLGLPIEELSRPGPPFLAWGHLVSRQLAEAAAPLPST